MQLASLAVLAILPSIRVLAEKSTCQTVVVFRSGSEPYDQAVAGIRQALGHAPCAVRYVDLGARDGARDMVRAISSSPKLVVAVGIGVVEQFREIRPHPPLLAALVLRADLKKDPADRAGAVYADVSIPMIAAGLHTAFPGKSRLGVIRGPSQPAPDAATVARLRRMGFDLRVAECPGPEKLLAVFESFKENADFVIALPDAALYNDATLAPLILASLEHRLPLIGFSAAFVRAGALAAVYPDFHALGEQAGQLALRLLAGHAPHTEQEMRKVVTGVNPQIGRLIGVNPRLSDAVTVLK